MRLMRHLWRYLIVLCIAGLVTSACIIKTSPGRSSRGSVVKHDGKHKKAKKAQKHKKAKKHKHVKHRDHRRR
jgi:hypothetical protein